MNTAAQADNSAIGNTQTDRLYEFKKQSTTLGKSGKHYFEEHLAHISSHIAALNSLNFMILSQLQRLGRQTDRRRLQADPFYTTRKEVTFSWSHAVGQQTGISSPRHKRTAHVTGPVKEAPLLSLSVQNCTTNIQSLQIWQHCVQRILQCSIYPRFPLDLGFCQPDAPPKKSRPRIQVMYPRGQSVVNPSGKFPYDHCQASSLFPFSLRRSRRQNMTFFKNST